MKHIPLLAVAEVIGSLDLTGEQTRRAATCTELVVQRAWSRRPASQRRESFTEFAAAVPARNWRVMFEVCALLQLGRHHDALAAISRAHQAHSHNEPATPNTSR
ncbi:hypothetical protein ACGFRG_05795 [Streptomyces sp. NPDC048696]|uniref:hypothetical protein n=1 Tax=Streptomyces sp. NPDC048696 TaxID=3365585 RepID=UPI00371DBD2B